MSPFQIAFSVKSNGILTFIDYVVKALFAIDVFVTFRVSYLDETTHIVVDDPKLIALTYAKTWMTFDVIAAIPFEFFFSTGVRWYVSLAFFRLWRLRKIKIREMFQRFENDLDYNYFVVRILWLAFVMLFQTHLSACFFYLLCDRYSDPKKTWLGSTVDNFHAMPLLDRYIMSAYWSTITLTTAGYKNLPHVNTQEMMFVIFYLFNVVMGAYIIRSGTSMVRQQTSLTLELKENVEKVTIFAKRNQLPSQLVDQMMAHLNLRYRIDTKGLNKQETLDALPKYIRWNILNSLFHSTVEDVYLFRGISNEIIFQLVSKMKIEYFPRAEDIISQNDIPMNLYILVNGEVELISQENEIEQVVGSCTSGGVFGEVGTVCNRAEPLTVRTRKSSQVLRLKRTCLLKIVKANARNGAIIMTNLLQHLREYEDPVMQGLLNDIEYMLGDGKIGMPFGLS